jgi:hypothetical protein
MEDLILGSNSETLGLEYIPEDIRYLHSVLVGIPGKGKTTLQLNWALRDAEAENPYGIIVIDSGSLAEELIESIPKDIYETRVRYFSLTNPIPYNPFIKYMHKPWRLVNEVVALIDQITTQASSIQRLTPRMKRLLGVAIRNCIKENTRPNIGTLCQYLEKNRHVIRDILLIKEDRFLESYEAIVDRLDQFVSDPEIRRVLCGPHVLDFDRVVDESKILIINLQGLDKRMTRFLGTLLFHGLINAVLFRKKPDRRDVAIYVDEMHNCLASQYSVENFQDLFKEGRKYRASLSVAYQDFGKIDKDLLTTIHDCAGVQVAFGCGDVAAAKMSRVFGGKYTTQQIQFQEKFHCIARVDNDIWPIETDYPPDQVRRILYDKMVYTKTDPPYPFEPRNNPPEFSTRQGAEEAAPYANMKEDEQRIDLAAIARGARKKTKRD